MNTYVAEELESAPDAASLLNQGDEFHGYIIQRCIGEGAAASVYLAKHEVLDAYFAIKILHPSVVSEGDPEFLRRFLREARLATRIRHPNLVSVHDCGHDDDRDVYYLVMDYVPGTSLRNVLAFEGRLSVKYATSIVAQVASVLEAAKPFQVVHRDIKPENIMVQPDGCVKLVDLGIAKAQNLGDSLCTNTDSTFGTPSYISPEQAQCAAHVDTRADVYSLGMVLFEMLTGKCPYVGDNPALVLSQILSDDPVPDIRDFNPDVPVGLAILVRRMTVKDRDRRIGSFKTVLEELERLGFGQIMNIPFRTEYATRPQTGMKTLLEGVGQKPQGVSDPLSDPDDDVCEFLSKRTRHRNGMPMLVPVTVLGAAVVIVLIVFLILHL